MQLVRETAIQCLVAVSVMPHTRIYPMRIQVIQLSMHKKQLHIIFQFPGGLDFYTIPPLSSAHSSLVGQNLVLVDGYRVQTFLFFFFFSAFWLFPTICHGAIRKSTPTPKSVYIDGNYVCWMFLFENIGTESFV